MSNIIRKHQTSERHSATTSRASLELPYLTSLLSDVPTFHLVAADSILINSVLGPRVYRKEADLTWTFFLECDWSCNACSGPLRTDCLQCMDGYVLQDGACVEQCAPSFYRASGLCKSKCLEPLLCAHPSFSLLWFYCSEKESVASFHSGFSRISGCFS